jgi:hypothetical protein
MGSKWTPEQRKRFAETMARKKAQATLPPPKGNGMALTRALTELRTQRVRAEQRLEELEKAISALTNLQRPQRP